MALQGSFDGRVRQAIQEIEAGRMVILVDDEDRENEGDLVLAADRVNPESVNFMATHARGLICLTLTEDQVRRLGLAMMVDENRSSRSTAFTVSIEAREGVTTGISAFDRAHTIRVASSPSATPDDIVAPGHVFPLRGKPGGVLQRTGHTEGSIDLVRLASLAPAAVICEIMNDDGSMARLPDLERFAERHKLHILTIEDLIHFRLQHERLVKRIATYAFRPAGFAATWNAHVYEAIESKQYVALTLGQPDADRPTLVRMHRGSLFADLFAPEGGPLPGGISGGVHLNESMRRIEADGSGVVVYIPPVRADVAAEIRLLQERGTRPVAAGRTGDGRPPHRDFGLGAQVLLDCGLRRIRMLTSNPRKFVGLAGYGLEVVEHITIGASSAGRA